jgi:hypothetical protein
MFCFGQFILLMLLDGGMWLLRRKYLSTHPEAVIVHHTDTKVGTSAFF